MSITRRAASFRSLTLALLLALVAPSSFAWAQRGPRARRLYQPHAAGAPAIPAPVITPQARGLARARALQRVHVAQDFYPQTRQAALQVMERFPPATHYYVGVGRSPSRIIAFLRTLSADGDDVTRPHTELATTIPASGLKTPVPEARYPEYFRHFERFIPEHVIQGDRTILLMDSSSTGSSIRNLQVVLQAFLASRQSRARVVGLGFSARPLPGIETMPPVQGSLGQDAAEFGQHTISTGHRLEQLQPNPGHAATRAQFVQRMRGDMVLDGALTTRFQDLLSPEPAAAPQPEPSRPAAPAPESDSGGRSGRAPMFVTYRDARVQVLDRPMFESYRYGAERLRAAVPSGARVVYVGVGRSSSPLLAFLQNLGDTVAYLPSDGVHRDEMTPELEQQFDRYFDEYVRVDDGTTFVLFQRSDTGVSLPRVRQLLESYLARRGRHGQVRAVAFTTGRAEGVADRVEYVDTQSHPALTNMTEIGKAVALFDYHRIGTTDPAELRVARPEYERFRSELRQYMEEEARSAGGRGTPQ